MKGIVVAPARVVLVRCGRLSRPATSALLGFFRVTSHVDCQPLGLASAVHVLEHAPGPLFLHLRRGGGALLDLWRFYVWMVSVGQGRELLAGGADGRRASPLGVY